MAREQYRLVDDAFVHFLTFSVIEWLPVFVSQHACDVITDSLNYCHSHKRLRTNAFVIMPTHLHLVVFDEEYDNAALHKAIHDLRKFTGRKLSDFCAEFMPASFGDALRKHSTTDRNRRFWQPSIHPIGLQTESVWRQKVNYIHENPVRKGLVTTAAHWRFSSAAYFASDGKGQSEVNLTALCFD